MPPADIIAQEKTRAAQVWRELEGVEWLYKARPIIQRHLLATRMEQIKADALMVSGHHTIGASVYTLRELAIALETAAKEEQVSDGWICPGCRVCHPKGTPCYPGYYTEVAGSANALPTPESQIESLQRELAKAQAMTARWKKAIEGLTPSGSEFVDDPQACAQFIRHKSTYPPIIGRLQKELDEAQSEVARLTAAIESWKAEEALWKEREAQLLACLAECEAKLGHMEGQDIALRINQKVEYSPAPRDPGQGWPDVSRED